MRRLLDADFLKWFYPGMHIKRWLALMIIGVAIMTFGLAYIMREAYISGFTFPGFVYYLTFQFIPRYIRGVTFMISAGGLIIYAFFKLNHSIVSAVMPSRNGNESIVNMIYNHRALRRGPKIVAIGGGTGLATLLRGLKSYTTNLTAVVTVADDGGSSGRLRRELGTLPPGDVRNCIAALADAEPLMTSLFQYRFSNGSGLAGHSFGNLFIVAMSGVVGNFEDAIRQTSRVLAVRGQIIPSTLANVTLCAKTEDAQTITGESSISETKAKGRIKEVYLQPEDSPAHPEAVRAILDADMIILGPGSLYTSILPNLLVQGIRRAFAASPAIKAYICNVATQPGETDGFSLAQHVDAIEEHVGGHLLRWVVANNNLKGTLPNADLSQPVAVDALMENGIRLVKADVVSESNRYHHDSRKLAETMMRIYYNRNQPQIAAPEADKKLVGALEK
ncbi:MAG: gluconeogenesis factor YvcK family protein [Dehalococcoidia bacterium]